MYRELICLNKESHEERIVYQIQNEIWPDHGVPTDYASFIDFVLEIRELRKANKHLPILVHCRQRKLFNRKIFYEFFILHQCGNRSNRCPNLSGNSSMSYGEQSTCFPIKYRSTNARTTFRNDTNSCKMNYFLFHSTTCRFQSQYQFACEAILYAYDRGLIEINNN